MAGHLRERAARRGALALSWFGPPRTVYKYHFRRGGLIVYAGISEDLDREERRLRAKFGESGRISQIGRPTTREAALQWERNMHNRGVATRRAMLHIKRRAMRTIKVDDQVVFTREDGESVVARVDHVWSELIVNLTERKSGEAHTSVPHKSAVPGAGTFYWE